MPRMPTIPRNERPPTPKFKYFLFLGILGLFGLFGILLLALHSHKLLKRGLGKHAKTCYNALMALNRLPRLQTRILALLFVLVAEGGVLSVMATDRGMALTAGLTLPRTPIITKWAIVEPVEVASGATIPPDTNVTFHLPMDMGSIRREVLLGNRGWSVRYWGYCFPDEDDPNNPAQDVGFPGRLFLSELERYVRLKNSYFPLYPIFDPPTKEELERDLATATTHGAIRHQVEVFTGGQNCYIMADGVLPIGTDADGDGLNSRLETQHGTDPENPDTDQDGAFDGVEVNTLGTSPTIADTDNDGIPDGIEVHGHSRVMLGDTDPLNMDSDRDGLCDGLCQVDRNRQYCTPDAIPRCTGYAKRWAGEDKNLNGEVDDDEYDPLKQDTDENGILDLQEFYNCLLGGNNDC